MLERVLMTAVVYLLVIIAFLIMNLVVVPLSAASGTFPQGAPLVNGILIHMFVGVPAAYAARAAQRA